MRYLGALIAFLLPAVAFAQSVGSYGAAILFHPGYIVSDWYTPAGYIQAAASPANSGSGTAVCAFGSVLQTVTINALGGRITTSSGGGNVQFAVYTNGAWGRPGTLLASTASITTASTGAVNAAVSVQLAAGNYWWCQNVDNGTVVLSSQTNAITGPPQTLLGTATQGSAGTGPASLITGVSISETFGTWPNFTSGSSWTDVNTNISPIITFKVASSP